MKLTCNIFAIITLCCCPLFSAQGKDWKSYFQAETLDVFLNGKSAGELISLIAPDDNGIVIKNTISTALDDGRGNLIKADLVEARYYNADFTLKRALQEMISPAGRNRWELVRNKQKKWELKSWLGGVESSKILPAVHDKSISFLEIYDGLKKQTLKVNQSWVDTVIELTSGENIVSSVTCLEKASPQNGYVWKFREKNSIQNEIQSWIVDTNGNTIEHEIFPFVAKRKGSKESNDSAANIFESFRIPVSGTITHNDKLIITTDSMFTLDSSVRHFYRPVNNGFEFIRLTDSCSAGRAVTADSLKRYLLPTPTLQVNHPEIRSLAKKLAGSSKPCEINVLNKYVFTKMEKRYTATFSSALESLRSGFGDCGEHAVLLAALLRASGVPARIVNGVVYMPEKNGYYYHVWVMAHDGTDWLFADPAFGLFPATFDRLPFVIDDEGEKLMAIAKVIGKISVKVVK
jgi:Transglutaminase-like superfamily